MTPERWQQIKSLVNSALAQNAEDRAAVLQQSCAEDLSLRRGAEALLSFHEQATRNMVNAPARLSSAGTMSPERWQQIEQLFQSALDLQPAERAAFLAKACGDDAELRHEVEALLVFQTGMSGVIEGAVHQAAGFLANTNEKARFTPGMTLNKRYRIIGQLGKGGMGEVYRADDLKLGHPVALKFLTEKLSNDKAMLARFHSEVAMAHRVTHPNVCRVHDIGEVTTSSGKLHFLSMEYVDGEDLSSLLRRIGRLPADKAVEIANQLCAGLAAAHEAGVLHRDLKPANVMLDGKGRVRITDFGLAGFAEQIRGEEVFAGTPAYMSPEQFAGKEVTTKSDIYALGLVLYEIFTGKRVFEANSLQELQRLHESSSPTNPSSWVKDIDPLVERVILRCLEKDPAKRLASAKQVADALPGGDPLAAALALGETPSPEMVAAAGGTSALKPKVAVACLAGVIALLLVAVWLNPKVSIPNSVPLDIPPDALARRAREFAVRFGYPDKPLDTVHEIGVNNTLLTYINQSTERRSLLSKERLATARPAYTYFWYRESPLYLIGETNFSNETGHVFFDDPPQTIAGMLSVRMDTMGRLRYFSAVPSQLDEGTSAGQKSFDWAGLFAAADFDHASFASTESQWTPPTVCDQRAAWTGHYPDLPQVPVRLEAAAYRGKLVYFQVIEPWTIPDRQPSPPPSRGQWIMELMVFLIFWAINFWALGLAWIHYRNGRGNDAASFRLACFSAVIFLFHWMLRAEHAPTSNERWNWVRAFIWAIGLGLIYYAYNMALEPFLRRRIPETLITWTRLLAGQIRDPRIGRDILIGLLVGGAVKNLLSTFYYFSGGFGLGSQVSADGRAALSGILAAPGIAIEWNLTILLLYFFLYRLLRRKWLAYLLTVPVTFAQLFFNFVANSANPRLVSIGLLIGAGALVYIVTQFGIVAGWFSLMSIIWLNFLTTSDLTAWHGIGGLYGVVTILVVAGFAFYTSLGGQKVFAGKLLEE